MTSCDDLIKIFIGRDQNDLILKNTRLYLEDKSNVKLISDALDRLQIWDECVHYSQALLGLRALQRQIVINTYGEDAFNNPKYLIEAITDRSPCVTPILYHMSYDKNVNYADVVNSALSYAQETKGSPHVQLLETFQNPAHVVFLMVKFKKSLEGFRRSIRMFTPFRFVSDMSLIRFAVRLDAVEYVELILDDSPQLINDVLPSGVNEQTLRKILNYPFGSSVVFGDEDTDLTQARLNKFRWIENDRSVGDITLLFDAAYSGSSEMIRTLIRHDAKFTYNSENKSPLNYIPEQYFNDCIPPLINLFKETTEKFPLLHTLPAKQFESLIMLIENRTYSVLDLFNREPNQLSNELFALIFYEQPSRAIELLTYLEEDLLATDGETDIEDIMDPSDSLSLIHRRLVPLKDPTFYTKIDFNVLNEIAESLIEHHHSGNSEKFSLHLKILYMTLRCFSTVVNSQSTVIVAKIYMVLLQNGIYSVAEFFNKVDPDLINIKLVDTNETILSVIHDSQLDNLFGFIVSHARPDFSRVSKVNESVMQRIDRLNMDYQAFPTEVYENLHNLFTEYTKSERELKLRAFTERSLNIFRQDTPEILNLKRQIIEKIESYNRCDSTGQTLIDLDLRNYYVNALILCKNHEDTVLQTDEITISSSRESPRFFLCNDGGIYTQEELANLANMSIRKKNFTEKKTFSEINEQDVNEKNLIRSEAICSLNRQPIKYIIELSTQNSCGATVYEENVCDPQKIQQLKDSLKSCLDSSMVYFSKEDYEKKLENISSVLQYCASMFPR